MKDLIKSMLLRLIVLHWTTVLTERNYCTNWFLYCNWRLYVRNVDCKISSISRFVYAIPFAEVVAMIGAFYNTERIPLMSIIIITALCRLIVLHSKEMESLDLIAEAGAIFILAGLHI